MSDWEDPLPILAGLHLCRAGKAPRLLSTGCFSTSRPGYLSESQRYMQEALQLGIPAAVMSSTSLVVNTAEEAAAILQLLLGRACIPLVTSAFHICFGQYLFER